MSISGTAQPMWWERYSELSDSPLPMLEEYRYTCTCNVVDVT